MNFMFSKYGVLLLVVSLVTNQTAYAWGKRGHYVIDRAAVEALPLDGPVFLKKYKDYIGDSSGIPDSWRGNSEPFSKIEEDPNHGWFMEEFAFMDKIPRSRYEFVIELYKQNTRLAKTDLKQAQRMNVRWAGTLPYALVEVYGRLVADMRLLRAVRAKGQDTTNLEMTCAMLTFWMGHYVGDGAQPLHNTIHHDGWQGSNPKNYSTDSKIHGRFESQYVEKINLTEEDILPRIGVPGSLDGDVFDTVLVFLKTGNQKVEQIYQLEKRQAFADPKDVEARELVYDRTAAGARLLRDLLNRAWKESALPTTEDPDPLVKESPAYNNETGSAPASFSIAIPH